MEAGPVSEWSSGSHEYLGEEPTDTGSRLLRKESLTVLRLRTGGLSAKNLPAHAAPKSKRRIRFAEPRSILPARGLARWGVPPETLTRSNSDQRLELPRTCYGPWTGVFSQFRQGQTIPGTKTKFDELAYYAPRFNT